MKICVLFEHFGPYHIARIWGAINAQSSELIIPVELFGHCNTYAWESPSWREDIGTKVVFEDADSQSISKADIREGIQLYLDAVKPDAVVVHGWSLPGAVAVIRWANANAVAVIVMSESRFSDSSRNRLKEFAKRKIIEHVSAGLVGAPSHADYLSQLGLASEAVFQGYNAVDNHYFASESFRVRHELGSDSHIDFLPSNFPYRFFFASCRFVEKKNLRRLLDAFAEYRRENETSWGLVLAGDGPLKSQLVQQIKSLQLTDSVHLPGFVQYDQLPIYYGLASAFVHVSTVEQWGLVVNEAAASGLPLIVSETTGSAECLVDHQVNGLLCNAFETKSITESLARIASLSEGERNSMGSQSEKIVAGYGPKQFGEGLISAASYAVENPKTPSLAGRVVVKLLS